MNFLGMADPGVITAGALPGFAYGTIKILAYGAMGVVAAGIVMTCLCDLLECRRWRQDRGRTEVWRLMH